MIYFTADLHFCHRNIIAFDNRPFENVDEMNETLIENWNKVVHKPDHVYIIGDMAHGVQSLEEIDSILSRLKGIKHLIIGNHDIRILKRYPEIKRHFKTISEYEKLHYTENGINRHLVLMHYPIVEWDRYFNGYEHIFGHVHASQNQPQFEYLQKQNYMHNAAVCINNYRPVTYDELVENNRIFYGRSVTRRMTRRRYDGLKEKIALMGRPGSGKDTLADYLCGRYGYTKYTFAEPLYKLCTEYFGMQEKNRALLQDVGMSMRGIFPDVFVELLKKKLNKADGNVVVSDVRQENEYNMLKELGFKFIFIDATESNRIRRIEKRDNIKVDGKYIIRMSTSIAETGCDKVIQKDKDIITIENNGTVEEFYRKIDSVIEGLKDK